VVLIQQSSERLDVTSNPLPQVVNEVLPNSESLARGQALYETACAAWQGTNDFAELVRRLPRLRDEELYAAVSSAGWWSLPPCEGEHSAEQWWDVVNYLRAMEGK